MYKRQAYVEDRSIDPAMDQAIYDHHESLNRLPRRNGRARNYNDTEEQLRHTIANYFGMISLIDHNVGRILDAIASRGLDNDTIVIFTSDHGDWLGDHGMMLKGPMFYEGLLRVGFLIKGPGIPAGKVVGDPISNTDVAATLLDYAGVESFYSMHGRSVRPMVESSSTSSD